MTELVEELTFKEWDDEDLDLKEDLLRGIYGYGYERPSNIQKKSIRPILNGRDVIVQCQSGMGKTACFVVSALQIVNPEVKKTQVVILAPTRELARQIRSVITDIGQYIKGLTISFLVGGGSVDEDLKSLIDKEPPHIVVGCAGRINDMIRRNHLKMADVSLLVLDEADEMLSVGFKDQVCNIVRNIGKDTQIALFSATMPDTLFSITAEFMRNPLEILVKQEQLTLEGISQYYITVDDDQQKYITLKDIFSRISVTQCIIYCNSVKRVKDLYYAMMSDKFPVVRLHSEMTDDERRETYDQFRTGKSRVLISSNVTARGIDIQQVSVVINFDIPKDTHVYLHRIGRSGRWGRKGVAINFITPRDSNKLNEIEKYYSTNITELPENFDKIISGC